MPVGGQESPADSFGPTCPRRAVALLIAAQIASGSPSPREAIGGFVDCSERHILTATMMR